MPGIGLDRADWKLSDPELAGLLEYDDGRPIVAMEYLPAQTDRGALVEWMRLRQLWLDLPTHSHVLDALHRGDEGKLLLRYAALEWSHAGIWLGTNARAIQIVAEWGVQVTDAMITVLAGAPEGEAGRFLWPIVWIDLGGAARVGFQPVELGHAGRPGSPPEAMNAWPACDERSMVFVIGHLLRSYCNELDRPEAEPIARIIERCAEPNPSNRYRTLIDLRHAWEVVAGKSALRTGEGLAAWALAEEGLGWLALEQPKRAFDRFEEALELDRYLHVAKLGTQRAVDMLGIARGAAYAGQTSPLAWSEAAEQGRPAEAERAFDKALAFYERVATDGAHDAMLYTSMARCHLARGAAAHAVDYAQRALAVDSKHVEAHAIRARGYLQLKRYEDALKCAGAWVAASKDDAAAYYVRGRARLAVHRYLEARDDFDRACSLHPGMIEAMLLRREADRAAAHVRDEVGRQPDLVIDLPAHLEGLRDALAHGRIAEMIDVLARPDYATDAVAQLVRGRCLAFERRFAEALAAFERAESSAEHADAARVGKAHALLALGRAEESLKLFDQACERAPGDLEAIEGRALALRNLGRDAEAEEALGKVYAASGGRSDLRVDSVRVER